MFRFSIRQSVGSLGIQVFVELIHGGIPLTLVISLLFSYPRVLCVRAFHPAFDAFSTRFLVCCTNLISPSHFPTLSFMN